MKKITAIILVLCLLMTGCSSPKEEDTSNQGKDTEIILDESYVRDYDLKDPELLTYIEEAVFKEIQSNLTDDEYVEEVHNVKAIYYSKEYIDNVAYNTKENIYFGYSLSELDKQFNGKRYVFTVGDDGGTAVKEMETFTDDTPQQIMKNVAIGAGVILICVSVSVVSKTAGASTICMIFTAASKGAVNHALYGTVIGGVSAALIEAYKTGDIDAVKDATIIGSSEGFKWGAITGAISGGISALREIKANKVLKNLYGGDNPTWRDSELKVLEKYGGKDNISFLNGEEVPHGTPGSTRPDVLRELNGHLDAMEVKNFSLEKSSNVSELISELEREVGARNVHLPKDTTQSVVLDVTGRGYSNELIQNVVSKIHEALKDIYPEIPVIIMDL